MDHLPTPESASGPPIEIPFVADIPWDYLDFASFPTRHGFAVDDTTGQIQLDEIDGKRLPSLLQSWLYFGFLSETFGTTVRHEDFQRTRPAYLTRPAAVLLDSKCLEHLITSWKRETYHRSLLQKLLFRNGKAPRIIEELKDRLAIVQRACAHVARYPCGLSPPIPEILLSIEVLSSSLYDVVSSSRLHNLFPSSHLCSLGSARLITRQMINAGWCRAIATQVSKQYPRILVLYFISRIKPPRVPWIHHDQCSDFHCVANHVDQSTYENRHVSERCQCSLIAVQGEERKKMIRIITTGGVPLIKIKEISRSTIELEVLEHKPGISYIAISHVWSDGLGNPHSNALPLCQLRKLASLFKQHPSTGTLWAGSSPEIFWMDTLCIPPATNAREPEYPLRLDCINRMAFIYASAWSVLVLDSGLQQIRLGAYSTDEIMAHLTCCAWNHRCWTLQEGALGRRVSFQLADGIMNPYPRFVFLHTHKWEHLNISDYRKRSCLPTIVDKIGRYFLWFFMFRVGRRKNVWRKTLRRSLEYHLHSSLKTVNNKESETGGSRKDFTQAWNTLRKRTTTKPEDLYVVLANILGFHPSHLSHESIGEINKLKAIILSIDRVPLSLLYNTGRRIPGGEGASCGQRWIPAEIGKTTLSDLDMERSAKGFVIGRGWHSNNLPGLILLASPICKEVSPIWLRCNHSELPSLGQNSILSNAAVWIRIDIYRISTHTQYDSSLYKESCVLIDQLGDGFNNQQRLGGFRYETVWNAALLHTSKTIGSDGSYKGPALPIHERLRIFRWLCSLPRLFSIGKWIPYRQSSPGQSHMSVKKDIFRATYDCPAKVTIFADPKPRRKSRRMSLDFSEGPLPNGPQEHFEEPILRNIDLPKDVPWRSQYDARRARRLTPSVVQDDCTTRNKKLIVDDGPPNAVRFPESWELIVDTPEANEDTPLKYRPYTFRTSKALSMSPISYVTSVAMSLGPLAVVLLLCINTPDRVESSWPWTSLVIFHCIYVIIFMTRRGTLKESFYLYFISFMLALMFYWNVVATNSLLKFAILPSLGGILLAGVLGVVLHFGLRSFYYKYWLFTFDKDWKPEMVSWWFRPFNFRGSRTMFRSQASV